jgi:cytochrome P450
VGASETTDNILNFAILYLILYPEVQDTIFKEIKTVIGVSRWPLKDDKEK